MEKQQFEKALAKISWDELHEYVVMCWGHFQRIDIYSPLEYDNPFVPMSSSEYTFSDDRLGSLPTMEYSDEEHFNEWLERDDEGNLVETETGRVWDEDEALKASIHEGYWVELYDSWEEELRRQFSEYLEEKEGYSYLRD